MLLGISTYFLNFERQTITVTSGITQGKVLEYYAPGWDPFPHYVDLVIDSQDALNLFITIEGVNNQTEHLTMNAGKKHVIVYPNDNLLIEFQNPRSTMGTIRSTLWCDSWTYAAGFFFILGSTLLIIGLWKEKIQSK
jgi:hypothetical protein